MVQANIVDAAISVMRVLMDLEKALCSNVSPVRELTMTGNYQD
jgi:hypothetical protein